MKYLKHENKFLYLLSAMGIMMVAVPDAELPGGKDWIVQIIYLAMLLGALYAMKKRKRGIVTSTLIAMSGFALNTSGLMMNIKLLSLTGDGLYLLFYLIFIASVLSDVLKSPKVTKDSFCGVICVYLMIGIFYATLYKALEYAMPGSFTNVNIMTYSTGDPSFFNLLYFSFITLATVGYGDITPLSPIAKSLVILESTTGVFYIAILISHLIGHSQRQHTE
ncbi:MAG: hypothetical protein A2020_10920 [Lentisphaerae bacterium GWF2_45_14]|nr:MAG: hypothetical protein A2020_10920 [Lentisphaerae bacterium GWF2_45_14]